MCSSVQWGANPPTTFDLVDDRRRVKRSVRNNGPVTKSATTWKSEKRPLGTSVNYARRRECFPVQWWLTLLASVRGSNVVLDVVGYTRRGTVHTGWASRTLEVKEERRWTGTAAICGHRVDEQTARTRVVSHLAQPSDNQDR